ASCSIIPRYKPSFVSLGIFIINLLRSYEELNHYFKLSTSLTSSSKRIRTEGVYVSSYCLVLFAQKKAPKNIKAIKTLNPINKNMMFIFSKSKVKSKK